MSSGLRTPAFADFSDADLAQYVAELMGQQQAAAGLSPTAPVMPTRGAGQVEESGRGVGPIDQRRPPSPFAANEGQTQTLERQQAGPQDLAALGAPQGSADHLLFDRMGMGGGLNPFAGRAEPYASRPVPLPPQRPSDADLMAPAPSPTMTGSIPGANPGPVVGGGAPQRPVPGALSAPQPQAPGQPPAADPVGALPANAFDPLTGQVVAGAPQRLGAPQATGLSPAPAGAMQPTAAGQPGVSDMFGKFLTGIQNPAVSDLLLNMGIGLLSNRGFGPGLAAGLQGYQNSSNGLVKQQLEQFKLQQMLQGQQTLRADLIRRGYSPAQAEAGVYNPTILSDMLARDKPNYQTVGGNIYDLNRNGGVPGSANLVGPASGPPAGYRLAADGKSYEHIPGSEADPAVKERNALAVARDQTVTPLITLEERRASGIRDYDQRSAWKSAGGAVKFDDGPKPQISTTRNPDGSSTARRYDAPTDTFREIPGSGGAIDTTGVPPGADPSTYRRETAKRLAAEGGAADQRALQAQGAIPILDRAEAAYSRLAQNGGIGPYQSSQLNRTVTGAMGRQNEVDRQEFEAAAKQLELLQAQISMKGQGAITEGERRILALTLPRLDAASPDTGLGTLRGMRQQFQKAIDAPGLPGSPREQRTETPAAAPPGAVQALQQNPALRDQFDAKYGRGAAARALGGR